MATKDSNKIIIGDLSDFRSLYSATGYSLIYLSLRPYVLTLNDGVFIVLVQVFKNYSFDKSVLFY